MQDDEFEEQEEREDEDEDPRPGLGEDDAEGHENDGAEQEKIGRETFACHMDEPVLEPLPSQREEIEAGDEEPEGEGDDHLQVAREVAPVDEGPRHGIRAVDLLVEEDARVPGGQLEEPVERLEGAHGDETGDDPADLPPAGDRPDDEEPRENVGRELEAFAKRLGRDDRQAQELRAREARGEGFVEGVGPRREDADKEHRKRQGLEDDEGE